MVVEVYGQVVACRVKSANEIFHDYNLCVWRGGGAFGGGGGRQILDQHSYEAINCTDKLQWQLILSGIRMFYMGHIHWLYDVSDMSSRTNRL